MKEEIKKMIDKLDIYDILHKEILEFIYNYLEKIKRDWIYNTVSQIVDKITIFTYIKWLFSFL